MTLSIPKPRVLIVDDQLSMAEMLAEGLAEHGYLATAESSAKKAVKLLESEHVDVLVTDLRMPQIDGLEMLAISKKLDAARPVIVMTAYSAMDTAIESIRRGAYHYLTKPFKLDELVLFLGRALDEVRLRKESISLKRTLKDRFSLQNFVGKSAGMRAVADMVHRIADTDVPVLLLGETGTGKGVVARAIHGEGPRASAPFVTINCAALPENLLESELFGHVRGAFSGATHARDGLFAEADQGTLFLDEIAEMSPQLQAKLLHVLESNTIRPVGGTKERIVDVRIVAATHRDLRARVAAGEFREDLLYRLEVVSIELPPLRHRRDDILELIAHFLAREMGKHPRSPVQRFSPDALTRLLEHGWPGNVRELEHVIERLVVLCAHEEISVADLPTTLRALPSGPHFSGPVLPIREVQRRYAAWAYEQLEFRRMLTAEKLGIDDKTLAKWLAADASE